MGNTVSLLTRPFRMINVENRAHKVISREKPTPAPTYESAKKQLEIAQAADPEFLQHHYKKDEGLNERLKNVYVQSKDHAVSEAKTNPDRPLPLLTRSGEDFKYGFWEPEKAASGRCTLGTAMKFMSEYMDDPVKNSAEAIATKHTLDVKDVENILQHFRVFKIVQSEDGERTTYVERIFITTEDKYDKLQKPR